MPIQTIPCLNPNRSGSSFEAKKVLMVTLLAS